jgi:uncharacterized protein Veg
MEVEVPPVNRVDQIHDELGALQGNRIKVRANMGRSRIIERAGTLVQAHPSLFVVEVEERRGRRARQSYQYVDVLTGMVEIYDVNTGERILDCAVLEEESHALCDLLCAARACGLTLRRADTLPATYGENIVIYHPLFCAPSEESELLFLLYLTLFQPRARATARYLHLKGEFI